MHADKKFKALIDSGAALSLFQTSIYNMIENCYKTTILPAAVHLKTANGSTMSSLGKATLHLHSANFKFSHTFITCDKLPGTNILFGIDIHKSTLYHIVGCGQTIIHTEGRIVFNLYQEL